MEKVYRLLQWLDTRQAVDWLQDMTATPLTERELLQLCGAKQCDIYISVTGLEGVCFDADGNEKKCTGKGYQKVKGRWFDPPFQHFQFEGQYFEHPIDPAPWPVEGYWEATDEIEAGHGIYFKPSDIEALAAKMNGVSERAVEVEALRQELEQERAIRQVIESELRERRAQDGTTNLGAIRQMLAHTPAEFTAMRERAENAELMVAALDKQITEQTERLRRSEDIAIELGKRLSVYHKDQKPEHQPEATATGLTFPYATKHLEAMRDAALEYWQQHDRSKPAPYGIQKEVQKFLAGRTGENARKLAELAAAIKPDDLPKS